MNVEKAIKYMQLHSTSPIDELLVHRVFRELFRTGLVNEKDTYLISRKDGNFFIQREP